MKKDKHTFFILFLFNDFILKKKKGKTNNILKLKKIEKKM